MLVLSRKKGERIVIGGNIEVTVVGVRGNCVRLGFRAPDEVAIHREEIFQQITQSLPDDNERFTELTSGCL